MIEYVLVYAWNINGKVRRIPLILKDRPDYLKGILNLPGGKIEDESPTDAAIRELKEETGLDAVGSILPGSIMGKIIDIKGAYVIYCVRVPVFHQELSPQKGETE